MLLYSCTNVHANMIIVVGHEQIIICLLYYVELNC